MAMLDEVGGNKAVSAVVDEFYTRMTSDPRTESIFAGRDLARLRRHQVIVFSVLLGGIDPTASNFPGLDQHEGDLVSWVVAAHTGLGFDSDAYDALEEHLAGALAKFEVPGHITEHLLTQARTLREPILDVTSSR